MALSTERWAKLCAMLQAREAAAQMAAAPAPRLTRRYGLESSRANPEECLNGGVAGVASTDWVPVLDVFTSAALSESEEALMRRVIAARVAPAPTISYTRRPL